MEHWTRARRKRDLLISVVQCDACAREQLLELFVQRSPWIETRSDELEQKTQARSVMICVEAMFSENRIVGIEDRLLRPCFKFVLVLCTQDDVVEKRDI